MLTNTVITNTYSEIEEVNLTNEVFIKQKKYFDTGETLDISFRKTQLKKLLKLIEDNEDVLCDAIYKDFRKSKFDTILSEILVIKNDIKHSISKLNSWSKSKYVFTNSSNMPGYSKLIFEPFGNCLIVGAWNYPYILTFQPLIAAITAGNVCLVKPSGTAENTAKIIVKLLNENFATEYIHAVSGRGSIVEKILDNPFDKVFFTGSPKVGKDIMRLCAKHLTNVTLELGGKSPAVFTKEGITDVALQRFAWGKFFNAGQTCIAPDYVLVPKDQEEKFLVGMKKAIEKVIGDYKTSETFCQVITSKHLNNLVELIDKDKVYSGGNIDFENRLLEPTVLRNVELSDKVMQDEIFGPILPVLTYNTIEEAVKIIKNFPKPLSFHYYTGSNTKASNYLLEKIPSGTGGINDSIVFMANHNLPFGGVGNSGMGKYHGKYGFKAFSNLKGVLSRPLWFELPFKYRPFSDFKLFVIKHLM